MATSPAVVRKHLRGASYPADLDDLIVQAEENDAPSDVIETIETLEERTYDGPADVTEALGGVDDDD